jgi:CSLREA domain-containing protein
METEKSPGQNTFHSKQLVIVVFATALVVSVAFLVFFVAMGEGRGPIPMLVASLILMGCFAPVIGLVQWSTSCASGCRAQRYGCWRPCSVYGSPARTVNKNTAFQKEELKMKIKVRFCLSVLAILALILLAAVAEAVPLPDALGIQPAIGSVGSENPLSSEYGNFPQANILVTTLADVSAVDGYCSLREAIQAANTDTAVNECPAGAWPGTDTITFSVSGTITLSSQLEVTGTGPLLVDGSNGITISGGDSVRIFSLSDTALLTLVELSLVDGTAVEGGAIKNLSNLTLWDSTISGSQATGNSTGGGGIYNTGILKVFNSTLSGNEASSNSGRGGAIYNHQGTVYLTNTTLSGNYAAEDGGGIFSTGILYLANATLSNNNAGDHGGGVFTQNYALYIRNTIWRRTQPAFIAQTVM